MSQTLHLIQPLEIKSSPLNREQNTNEYTCIDNSFMGLQETFCISGVMDVMERKRIKFIAFVLQIKFTKLKLKPVSKQFDYG